ncbi:hypothetical protein [Arthrobacter sp. zg-Y1143]|uniref:hypothetical protein n=1 Tax=Arthrobacter sp. zg-Y1143 TaxID=3049065 RepID=UPI0024C343C4|nr:hypothetical protein [Arthrobacter sp. zg-Y1143]MDK1326524.1 hypothetical protein [Arthrobacter sp. zg-Y1143]
MGIFKKRQPGGAESPDPHLTFFSISTANHFRALTRQVFAELGYEVTVYPDHAVDGTGRKFGFWNIAATCSPQPEPAWRSLISVHLQQRLRSFDAPSPFDTVPAADIPGHTFARLYDESSIPGLGNHPYREFAPGVVEMLALDLPESVAVFRHENARTFGGWEALRKQGMANLAGLKTELLEKVTSPENASFNILMGSSFYTASRALLLPGLATELTGKQVREDFGWLMSIPSRHQLMFHVIEDDSVLAALNNMAILTARGYSDSPGQISPYVYWWNGTGYDQLTHAGEDRRMRVRIEPGFQRVLEAVTAQKPAER